MTDDLDALFDAVANPTPMGSDDTDGASTMTEGIARYLGTLDLSSVSGSSVAARGALVDAYRQLRDIERLVHDRRVAIELAFIRAAAENGADEIRTSEGVVKLKAPNPGYDVKAQAMRQGLDRFVASGDISKEELDDACPVTITYGVNHTKLNKLARHRGDEVQAVIDANRTKREADPLMAKPQFPKPKT